MVWAISLSTLAVWRSGRVGGWLPTLVTAAELGVLYFTSFTVWGWAVRLPEQSPVLAAIAADPSVGKVGGVVFDMPVAAGMTTAAPYLGMTLTPLNQLLHSIHEHRARHDLAASLWERRLGVTHTVWDEPVAPVANEWEDAPRRDPALDALGYRPIGKPATRLWRLIHHPDPFPPVRLALRERVAPDWPTLLNILSNREARDEAWFYPADLPARDTSAPRARSARIVSWDGRAGVIEHDGACTLVITRAYDPGWHARIDDGPEIPVARVDEGLQAVRLNGAGSTARQPPVRAGHDSHIGHHLGHRDRGRHRYDRLRARRPFPAVRHAIDKRQRSG